ncbi:MAG: hypothetical protein LBR67_07065 [Dysgonamonadaceae bacterium]|jgi:hypothetical protein|nr:hypothetical protein [Dysgonamonadaceae bacterium]
MKRSAKVFTISLIIGFILFIGIALMMRLFIGSDLPVQISGTLLDAVVAALITYFLLAGQTSHEEVKERNVKVFEEKSARFNTFIDKLWTVWDDHSVDLEELNDLIKVVSQDIILYAKPETVNKILSCLIEIAEQANPFASDNQNKEVTKLIQNNIFTIINELAKEIGLGGEITPEINDKLDTLDELVIQKKNLRLT